MRRVLIVVAVIAVSFMLCSAVYADSLSISDQLKKIPALKQGIAYSILDSDFSYLSTLEVLNYKGFALEAGYSSNDKLVGVISYSLFKAKDYGINVPILDLIEFRPGIYCGYGRLDINDLDSAEWDLGLSVTLINVKG